MIDAVPLLLLFLFLRPRICHLLIDSGTSLIAAPAVYVAWLTQRLELSATCENLAALPALLLQLNGVCIWRAHARVPHAMRSCDSDAMIQSSIWRTGAIGIGAT
jgi:hypothetical protein